MCYTGGFLYDADAAGYLLVEKLQTPNSKLVYRSSTIFTANYNLDEKTTSSHSNRSYFCS